MAHKFLNGVQSYFNANNYTLLGYDSLDVIGGDLVLKRAGTEKLRIGADTSTSANDITITHANTPKLQIIDTTNDVDFRIRAANSYVYLEADADNDADSTRMQIKVDDNLVHEFMPGSQLSHKNLTLRREDTHPSYTFQSRRDSGNFVSGTDIARMNFQARDSVITSDTTLANWIIETDNTLAANDKKARMKWQVYTGSSLENVLFLDSDKSATFYGDIVTSGTVDGVDIATRDGVLTTTTTTANAALPKSGGTMTGDLTIQKDDPTLTLYNNGGANTDPNGTIIFSESNNTQNFDINYNGALDRLEFRGRVGNTDNTDLVLINRDLTTTLQVLGGATFAGDTTFEAGIVKKGSGGYYLHNSSGTFRAAFWDNGSETRLFADGNGSTAALVINDNNTTFAGNVGVTNILHIEGAATGSPYIDWRQDGSQKAYIQYADTGDDFNMSSDGKMTFKTGGENTAVTLNTNQTVNFHNSVYFSGSNVGLISWGSMGGGTGFGIRGESGRALSLGSNGAWDKLIIDTSGNSTFAGDVTINGSHLTLKNGTTYAQATDYLYIGGSGLDNADAAIYLGNRGDGNSYGWRFIYKGTGNGNTNNLVIQSENNGSPVDALTFNQDGTATFSGAVSATGIASTLGDSILISYSGNDGNGNDAGLKIMNDGNDWGAYIRKTSNGNYGLRIDSGGASALSIYSTTGGSTKTFGVNGSNGDTTLGALTASGIIKSNRAEAQFELESTHGRKTTLNQGGGNFHIQTDHGTGVGINYGNTSHPGLLKLYNNTTAKITLDADDGTIASGAIEATGVVDGAFTGLRIMNQKTYGSGTGTNETARLVLGIAENGAAHSSREGFVIETYTPEETDSSNIDTEFKVRDGGTIGTVMKFTGSNKNVDFYNHVNLQDDKGLMWGGNDILKHNGTQTYIGDNTAGNIVTITGGHATFAGNVNISGDLNITGDINSTSVTNLDVDDKTITIAKGAADSAAADGAGIVVDGASASLLYDHTGTQWEFNKPVEVKVGSSAITFTEHSNGATIWLDGSNGDMAGGDYFGIHAYGTTDLAFGYAASTKMTLKNTGWFGIGTDDPTFKFEVFDSSNSGTAIGIGNSGTGASRLYIDASNGDFTGSDYMWIGQNNDLSGEIFMPQNAGSFNIKTQPSGTTTTQVSVEQAGHVTFSQDILTDTDGSSDIGKTDKRWANIYADTLYGDGSNLTNLPSPSAPSNMVTTNTTQTISGAKTFSDDVTTSGNIILSGASNEIIKSNGSIRLNIDSDANQSDRIFIVSTGSNSELFRVDESGNGTFTGDINLGTGKSVYISGTSGLRLLHDGTDGHVITSTGDLKINNSAQNKDIIFRGNNAGSSFTALTLDMSEAGNATFAGNVGVTNILHIEGAATGSPYIDWRQDGSQKAYIQYADTGDDFNMSSDGKMTFKTGGENTAVTLNTNQTVNFHNSVYFSGSNVGLISWGSMGGGTGFGIRGESGRALSLGSNGAWDKLIIDTSGNTTFAGDVFIGDNKKLHGGRVHPRSVYSTANTNGFLIATDVASNAYAMIQGEIDLIQFNSSTKQRIEFSATLNNNGTVFNSKGTADIDITIKLFVYNSKWYVHVPQATTYMTCTAYISKANAYVGDDDANNSITNLTSATVPSSGVSGSTDIVCKFSQGDVSFAGNATFAGDVTAGNDASALSVLVNPSYADSNEYLQIHKRQSRDGGIVFRSKPTGGSGQNDWQVVNHATTGDLRFYAYGLSGFALTLDREDGNATFNGSVFVNGDNKQFWVKSADQNIARIIPRGSTGDNVDKGLFSLIASDSGSGQTNIEKVRIDSGGGSWFDGGDVRFGYNVTVDGNLTVEGTTTTLNTQTVEVKDNILQLNTTQGSPDTATATTSGISIYRGDGVAQASLIFDDTDDAWDLTNKLVVASTIASGNINISDGTPILTLIDTSSSATATLKLDGVNLTLQNNGTDGDFTIIGKDGSSNINLLTFDTSEGGVATFSGANTYNKIQSFYSGDYTSGWKFSDYNGGIWYDAGVDDLTVNAGHSNSQILFNSGGALALTLNASQDANFAGKVSSTHVKYFNTSISNSYVRAYFAASNTYQIATAVRLTGTSHGSGHVGNFTADILVNHYQDVFITSKSGAYTQVTLKVSSNNNGDYTLFVKSDSSNAATYYFKVEAISDNVDLTTLPSSTASSNTTHEHTTVFGSNATGTGGTLEHKHGGKLGMSSGYASGKFAVMSNNVHGSYDFYNNGTTYLNGATIVDAAFTQSGGGNSSFSGDVEIHKSGNDTTGKLTISGNNNTGTPGQKTSGTIEHRGEHLKTVITHNGSDVITIGTGTQTALAGNLDIGGTVTMSNSGNIFSDSNFQFLNTGSGAQVAKFKGIQLSASYSGTIPTAGILFGTDTNLYRSEANTLKTDDTLVAASATYTDGIIRSRKTIVSNSTYNVISLNSSRTVDDYGGLNKDYMKIDLVTPGPNTDGGSSAHGFGAFSLKLANNGANTNMTEVLNISAGANATFAGKITNSVNSGTNIEMKKGNGTGAIGFGGTSHQTGLIEGVDGGGLKLYTAGNDVNWGGAWSLNTTWSGQNMTVNGIVETNKIFVAKGQNVTHTASSIKISQENTTKSQIRFYGADTSTAGILEFTGSSSDGSVGGVRLTIGADGKATFANRVSHQGLEMTSGTQVDQYKYFPMTFQLTANTWTDTGIDGSDMSTGTYAMQVYVSDFNVGGGHYYEYYSGMMSWYGQGTNSTKVDEIVVHRAGHAPNNGDVQFRTERHASGVLMLQVKHNLSYTGALDDSNGGKIFRFKFRRLL